MLVTQRRGVSGGRTVASSPAIWLTTATTAGRERVKRNPAVRGRIVGSRLPLCPVPSPAGQSGRLSAVLEPQHLRRPERREIHQFSRAQHVGVGDEGSRPAPPHRVDLRKQENPDKRRQVARRAADIGLVVADLIHQACSEGVHTSVKVREDSCELRLSKPGDKPLGSERTGGCRASARFHKVVNCGPIAEELRIRQDGGYLSNCPRGIQSARRSRMLAHCLVPPRAGSVTILWPRNDRIFSPPPAAKPLSAPHF